MPWQCHGHMMSRITWASTAHVTSGLEKSGAINCYTVSNLNAFYIVAQSIPGLRFQPDASAAYSGNGLSATGGLLQLEHLHWPPILRPGPRSFPKFRRIRKDSHRATPHSCPQETGAQLQQDLARQHSSEKGCQFDDNLTLSSWDLSGKSLLMRR